MIESTPSLWHRAKGRVVRDGARLWAIAKFYGSGCDREWLRRAERGFDGARQGTVPANLDHILDRVIAAYRLAKEQQSAGLDLPYRAGVMWARILERHFSDLTRAIEADDRFALGRLLCNFQREQCSLGTGGCYDDWERWAASRFYRYEFVNTWLDYYRVLNEGGGNGGDPDYPLVGNPAGIELNENVVPLEALRYHYYAREFHSLLRDVDRPVICEIGGGLGGQAWSVASSAGRRFQYLVYDLPELLVVAGFFLLVALPDLRIVLFGEQPGADVPDNSCDIALLPNFELPTLSDVSVDLVFNSCSLSEMDRQTAEEYLRQIERVCSRYFLHSNHTAQTRWEGSGTTVENLPADRIVPNPSQFKRLYSHPRLFGRSADRWNLRRSGARHLVALYERMSNEARRRLR